MTPSLYDAIRSRFPEREYALAFEVRNDAGFKASRAADAIAVSLWPSRGLEVHGLEVKTARSDFLRELRDASKSEPIQRYCDRWWIVAGDASVAKVEELPVTWGLLVLRKGKLYAVKPAPKLDAAPLDRGFVVAMLKRASEDVVQKSVVEAEIARRVAAATAAIEARYARRVGKTVDGVDVTAALAEGVALKRTYEALQSAVDDFEKASGVRIRAYDGIHLGKAVAVVLSQHTALAGVMSRMRELAPMLADAIAELHAIEVRNDACARRPRS